MEDPSYADGRDRILGMMSGVGSCPKRDAFSSSFNGLHHTEATRPIAHEPPPSLATTLSVNLEPEASRVEMDARMLQVILIFRMAPRPVSRSRCEFNPPSASGPHLCQSRLLLRNTTLLLVELYSIHALNVDCAALNP